MLSKIHRTKFANPIMPENPVELKITYDADSAKVTFGYTSEQGDKKYSSGSFTMNPEQSLG